MLLGRVTDSLRSGSRIKIAACASLFAHLHRYLHSGSMAINEQTRETQEQVTRVLFCGPQFPYSHIYTREFLSKYPFIQVDDVPLDEVPNVIRNYHMCVPKMMRIDSDIISRAKKLKLILQYGVGLEGVDIDAATERGIKVARIPGHNTGNAASCAEMAIYLILGLLKKQKEMDNSIKLKRLGEPCGETLFGKTVFILGCGNIGLELAKRLRPFDVKILATKRSWSSSQMNGSWAQYNYVDGLVDEKGSHGDIYKFAGMADIVACCLNMNSETAGVVNHSFIHSMKKGAYLVNVARGGLLEYDAVADGLKSGHLGGLGIDVAWKEPFDPNDPILQHPNVILTPHVAGVTEHSYRSMAKVVGDVAVQLHQGSTMTGIEFVN
uniref:Phosphoglycerate dehydrogenase n=1 Tax=Opuntia streptacantha TaxID=393608 RepID=A0A7C8Z3J0_OPUST